MIDLDYLKAQKIDLQNAIEARQKLHENDFGSKMEELDAAIALAEKEQVANPGNVTDSTKQKSSDEDEKATEDLKASKEAK